MGFGHSHAHGQHSHGHSHDHGKGSGVERAEKHGSALVRALAVTLFFALIEMIGGLYANSLALISDAVHMLTDAAALVLSLLIVWVAKRKAPRGYTYGYQRVEVLGALVSALSIWLIAGLLIYESFERFQSPGEVKGGVLLVVATIGLGANLISLKFLHGSSKENMNVRSAYLHVLSDALGSVGAIIAGVVILMTGWVLIDPVITVMMSGLMLWSSWRLIRESIEVLMERSPSHLQVDEIEGALRGVEGVVDVHDLHVWTLSSGSVALSVHLVGKSSEKGLLHDAAHLLGERFQIRHTTIQVEDENSEEAEHCAPCE